jgi:hypothetical protein
MTLPGLSRIVDPDPDRIVPEPFTDPFYSYRNLGL